MQALLLRHRLSNSNTKSLFRLSSYFHSSSCSPRPFIPSPPSASSIATNLFTSPWSASQCRGIKVSGSDIKVGNIIGKQGSFAFWVIEFYTDDMIQLGTCSYVMLSNKFTLHSYCAGHVLKVDHSHEGRGKATIKVELRDIDQGNKVTQRMGTDEDVERVYVQEKTFMFMCMDSDGTVVLMDPDTLDQIEVSKDLFNKDCLYLRDEMKVKVHFYDDKPLSASVPKRVTCIVKEAIAATSRNKKVVLDNGLTVEVPSHIVAGDAIVVSTEHDSYIERAKA
ncbi:Elongation factor P [Glycine max]|nr:Elongation factor P [Glycine max]